ncbi:MAG: hypothetical protein ACI351_07075 [Candidatus Avelusimicrobium sp.]|uniref:hypothetical protein n=1 Tax=Candidatus Avelusimicrobium sp. TaxID=3048833 RepID=UPI003F122680
MNKNLFHLFFICLMIAFAAEPASAQKYLKNLGKGLKTIPSTVTKATTAASARWATMGTHITRTVARSHPKLYTNVQIVTGTPKITALRNTLEAGYEPHRYNPRPALQADKALAVRDFSAVMPAGTEAETPVIPFQNQRGLIYRGLALNADGQAIRNILENGLLIKDLGQYASDFITSVGAETARGRCHSMKVTNLTAESSEAVKWAQLRSQEEAIPVVMVVKYSSNKDLFSQDIHAINTAADIPPEDIYAMAALLNINGVPTWCKVELEGEGFRITPYEPVAE